MESSQSLLTFTRQESLKQRLETRCAQFYDYFCEQTHRGQALYGRRILSPMGPRVEVEAGGVRQSMLMFGSNNYLGFASDPYLTEVVASMTSRWGVGVAGPPLLNGMTAAHRSLEERLSTLKGHAETLLVASGYQANLCLLDGLIKPDDTVLFDECHHASFVDGLRLCRGRGVRFHFKRFRHNDTGDLQALLAAAHRKRKPHSDLFVAIEGVYSMDGDLPPLPEMMALCERFDAILLLDDAHGTGVLGPHGEGTAKHFGLQHHHRLITMGTFSKAFATHGGFISASAELVTYLRFFARPYIFSAHLPLSSVAAAHGALDLLQSQPERLVRLQSNARRMGERLAALGFAVSNQTAIIPVRVPLGLDIRHLNAQLHAAGLFVNAIEYPAVALNAQRLRLSVMATHSDEDIEAALAILAQVGKEFGLIN